MITTILFDLDGTLIDTIGGIGYCCNEVLEKYGYKTYGMSDYKDFVGMGLRQTLVGAVGYEPEHLNEMFLEFIEIYSENPLINTVMYDDVDKLLRTLDDMGITWGINTNKNHHIAERIVKALISEELLTSSNYLGLVGSSEQVPLKPDTTGARQLLNHQMAEDSVLFVGDSEVDINTGKNLGVKQVAVSWGFRSKEVLMSENPSYIINSPLELLELLEQ